MRLAALGVSFVARRPHEELVYVTFSGIVGELVLAATHRRVCVSIWDVQIDNQVGICIFFFVLQCLLELFT